MELPPWLLQEIGRLYVHALALERELKARDQPTDHQQPETKDPQ